MRITESFPDWRRLAARMAGLVAMTATLAIAGEPASGHTPGVQPLVAPLFSHASASDAAVTDPGAPPANPEINAALRGSWDRLASTNLLSPGSVRKAEARPLSPEERIEKARQQRLGRQGDQAVTNLMAVLESAAPEALKRTALLELALVAQDQGELPKVLQIFAQFQARWPDDPGAPEILLRQGLIYREMGLNQMALNKFYAVMSTALVLKSERLDYYRRLVLQAQTEVAETFYMQGNYEQASEFLARLLKSEDAALNKPRIHFKLIRALASLERPEEVVAQGHLFLERYVGAAEQPETRFLVALALQKLGRNSESLQQVLSLLKEQQQLAESQPQAWAYWQHRAGNEIANQLYLQGDYAAALSLYERLAQMDSGPAWQVPVWYQMGLAYERLAQPAKAKENYTAVLAREQELGTNAPPHLQTILDMARWRLSFVDWQSQAEASERQFQPAAWTAPTNASPGSISIPAS